jgi:ketosteroid isomerase-like protein
MRLRYLLLTALMALSQLAHAAPTQRQHEILEVERAWSRALAANDSGAIASYTNDAWVIEGADGRTTRDAFLKVIISHDLVHDRLESTPDTVRVYGDVALVSGIALSSGTWKGVGFATRERSTDVFVRRGGRWRCVFTQLTPLTTPTK